MDEKTVALCQWCIFEDTAPVPVDVNVVVADADIDIRGILDRLSDAGCEEFVHLAQRFLIKPAFELTQICHVNSLLQWLQMENVSPSRSRTICLVSSEGRSHFRHGTGGRGAPIPLWQSRKGIAPRRVHSCESKNERRERNIPPERARLLPSNISS